MLTNTGSTGIVNMLHLKKVGLVFASLWIVILVAAVAATIHRVFDGPTVRTVTAQNIDLSTVNSSLVTNLDAVQRDNALLNSQTELTALKRQFKSYVASVSTIKFAPKMPLSMEIRFFP